MNSCANIILTNGQPPIPNFHVALPSFFRHCIVSQGVVIYQSVDRSRHKDASDSRLVGRRRRMAPIPPKRSGATGIGVSKPRVCSRSRRALHSGMPAWCGVA
jgi:hypothetical protein